MQTYQGILSRLFKMVRIRQVWKIACIESFQINNIPRTHFYCREKKTPRKLFEKLLQRCLAAAASRLLIDWLAVGNFHTCNNKR